MTTLDANAAAQQAVLLVPAADRGAFQVRGADRTTWLNGLVTCNLAPLKAGGAAYGLAVTQKGRILADVVVLAEADRLVVTAPKAALGDLVASLEKYLIMEDAEVAPLDAVVWEAHGPKAADLVGAARGAGAVAAAVDATGLGDAVIVADANPSAVEAALASAVSAAGGVVADDATWEALRLSRGVPRFGRDFDSSTYPQEAGLEKRAVSFDKGCYLGQEVVCMLELRGHVKRKLTPLEIEGEASPGAEVVDANGTKVGTLTSAMTTGAKTVALAMLKVGATDLRVGAHAARVRALDP